MIELKTDCERCFHRGICRYKNNAKIAMEKLKNTIYGSNGSLRPINNDWDTVSTQDHYNISFSCPTFELDKEVAVFDM